MGGNLPTECIHFLSLSFVSLYWFSSLGQVSSYMQYCMSQGEPLFTMSYRYHKRILKLLQWKNPRGQWILKSPGHLDMLPSLFKVYPDARAVWSHRDPVKAFASGVDLLGLLQWVRTDHPLKDGIETLMSIEGAAQVLCRPIDWMEQGLVPKAQIFNAVFRDFTEDPVSAVEKIMMAKNLEVMFSTGLSLVKSFDILSAQAKNKKLKAALKKHAIKKH